MKANKFIHLLEHSNKEVIVKIDNDLYYPVRDVKISAENIIIYCHNVKTSAEMNDFKPAEYKTSAKYHKK